MLIEDIQSIKDSDLSPEEKKKKIRKLRRQARTQQIHPVKVQAEDFYSKILSEATLPDFDLHEKSGYAFSLKAASDTPTLTYQDLVKVFHKRFGYDPSEKNITVLPWDTLLIFGPVR
jgi:hypothetical protein